MNTFIQDISITSAAGAVVSDGEHSWQDLSAFGFGYQCPDVVNDVVAQMQRGGLSSRVLMSRPMLQLVEQLAQLTPEDLTMTYLCNSPDEAFEGAIKLARGHNPQRREIVVVGQADFGCMTYSRAMSWGGCNAADGWGVAVDLAFVPFAEIAALEQTVTARTLAVVVNPLEQLPELLLLGREQAQQIRQVADRHGALLIACELQTFGRCEGLFHSLVSGLSPDILVYGEALGGGVLPIGAYTARRCVNESVYGGRNLALHGSTTAGNPASCAAASAALKQMAARTEHEVIRRFAEVTSIAAERLRRVLAGSGIRVSTGPAALQLTLPGPSAAALAERLRQHGLLVWQRGNALRLSAPLLMTVSQWSDSLTVVVDFMKHTQANTDKELV